MARPITFAGKLIRPAITIGFLVVLGWFCRGRSSRNLASWLEVGLVLLAMLLMGERTWKHHATTLPIVYLAFWYALTCLPVSERLRTWMVAGLAMQFVLLVIGGEGFFGDEMAERMLEKGFFCWGLLLAAIQTAILLEAVRRPPIRA